MIFARRFSQGTKNKKKMTNLACCFSRGAMNKKTGRDDELCLSSLERCEEQKMGDNKQSSLSLERC